MVSKFCRPWTMVSDIYPQLALAHPPMTVLLPQGRFGAIAGAVSACDA
jgi:hypothetical protein